MKSSQESSSSIYRLRVSLVDLDPEIWRTVDVPSSFKLIEFHIVIQILMNWENSHLWNFVVENDEYTDPSYLENFYGDSAPKDATKIKLLDALRNPKDSIEYIYDFGDNWVHSIVLEDISEKDPKTSYPICISGEFAAPPEDCGGPMGFCDLMEIMNDPEHEEYESVKEWLGDDYNPHDFDLKSINVQLQKIFSRMQK